LGDENMHVEVEEDLCTGCGLCEERAPENMAMDEDGIAARVIKQPAGETETADCTEAIEYCPTGGLTATESDAGKRVA